MQTPARNYYLRHVKDEISHLADCVDQILRCLHGKDVMEEYQVCHIWSFHGSFRYDPFSKTHCPMCGTHECLP